MLSEAIRLFETWSLEQKLVERTIEACQVCLRNCATDEAEIAAQNGQPNPDSQLIYGHALNDFVLKLERQSLTIQSDNHDYPSIDTRLGLYLPDPKAVGELQYVGYYRFIVTADGEDCDDYLVFEDDFLENDLFENESAKA